MLLFFLAWNMAAEILVAEAVKKCCRSLYQCLNKMIKGLAHLKNRNRVTVVLILTVILIGCMESEPREDTAAKQTLLKVVKTVSAENLGRTIKDLENFGTRYTWEKQEATADYLIKRLSDYGLPVHIDEYSHQQKIWRNVITTFPGRKNPNATYMVISHYDSISESPENRAPGADDNATGTAAALEISRILKEVSLATTVQITFFSNEEQGHLGSKHLTRKARSENQDIRGTINLDVIGYNDPIGALEKTTHHVGSLLDQIKAQLKWYRNYAFSKLYPLGRVVVAGRPRNKELASKTTEILKEFTRLNVVTVIDEDCG
jgi:hypothetical protein